MAHHLIIHNTGSFHCLLGKLYVVGGSSEKKGESCTKRLVSMDIDTGEVATLVEMPTARELSGVATAEGKLFAIGGYSVPEELANCELYDVKENA